MAYERELEAALAASAQATAVILGHYADFQAIPDARANITTLADTAAQETILQHLRTVFPGDALCAEEVTPTLTSALRVGERLWVVDPIDGTRGFAKKIGEFSVMIALLHHGQPVVGVVQEPAFGRLTYATLGGGCWRRDGAGAAVPCRVTATAALSAATLIQSHSRAASEPTWAVKTLGVGRVIESYSAGLKMARVARGEADLYPNTYDAFSDWDICAGHILVTEAGGQVSGLAGQAIVYGQPGATQKNGMLASNGVLHSAAVARLQQSPR